MLLWVDEFLYNLLDNKVLTCRIIIAAGPILQVSPLGTRKLERWNRSFERKAVEGLTAII
jgi:hypothetical protein